MSIFTKVPKRKIPTSVFNLSEESKLSCNFGELIPILCKEVIPGDKFKLSTELLIKFAPLSAPVMHRIKAKVDYFFVPCYQLTNVFEKFINPKVNTADNPVILPYVKPTYIKQYGKRNDSLISSLADYLGLPVTQTGYFSSVTEKISVLPFVAYQHIYNSFYRDQNLEILENADASSTSLFLLDAIKDFEGDLSSSLFVANQFEQLFKLRVSAWHKDYFTSALPSPQAGDDVTIPVGDVAKVKGRLSFTDSEGEPVAGTTDFTTGTDGEFQAAKVPGVVVDGDVVGTADLSSATGISINKLRLLFQFQKFKERGERGGTRYPEIVRNFFPAFLPDPYFDRPQYLGGQVQNINIGEIVQTNTNDSHDLGYRGGIANSYGKTKTFNFKSTSHGFIMGILRIMPEATYSQGVERMWTRESIFDYAWPDFANLGEQEIRMRELYATGDSDDDNAVFGYTPRYAEYKEGHCHIAGEFRNSLAYWHFGRVFDNAPALNKQFVMMDSMNYQPFSVTSDSVEHVYVNLYNNIIARRPLPYFGTPGGI